MERLGDESLMSDSLTHEDVERLVIEAYKPTDGRATCLEESEGII